MKGIYEHIRLAAKYPLSKKQLAKKFWLDTLCPKILVAVECGFDSFVFYPELEFQEKWTDILGEELQDIAKAYGVKLCFSTNVESGKESISVSGIGRFIIAIRNDSLSLIDESSEESY